MTEGNVCESCPYKYAEQEIMQVMELKLDYLNLRQSHIYVTTASLLTKLHLRY